VFFHAAIDNDAPRSAIVDGELMIPLHYAAQDYGLMAWYMPNPPVGTLTVEVAYTKVAGSYEVAGAAFCLNGAEDVATYGDPASESSASTTTPSLSVDFVSGDFAITVIEGDPSGVGGDQTEVLQITTEGFNFGPLNVSTNSTNGDFSWTFAGAAVRVMLGVAVHPAGTAGVKPLPCEVLFDSRLINAVAPYVADIATYYADWEANGNGSAGAQNIISEADDGSYYYDGTWVFYEIGGYLGAAEPYNTAAWQQLTVLDAAYYVPYDDLPGYKYFVRGPYRDYQVRAEVTSLDMVEDLCNLPVWSQDGDNLSDPALIRELAYHIDGLTYAAKAGFTPRTARLAQCRDWAYAMLDYFFVDEDWVGVDVQFSPFMIGLLARALIEDWETSGDSRCLPALQTACDYLWDNAWDAANMGMGYQLNPAETQTGLNLTGSPVLNNLIGGMYAWVALQTGDSSYMDKADVMFAGSTFCIREQDGKQFNQQHTWVFQQMEWRTEFYVEASVAANPVVLFESSDVLIV
jgi:hypothetical protein